MKFFLDENLSYSTVEVFKKLGFSVEHVRDVKLQGATDKEIASYAKSIKAILVTKDVEFGSIVLYPPGSHFGVIILRLPHQSTSEDINAALGKFLKTIDCSSLVNSITVIEKGRYRKRKVI